MLVFDIHISCYTIAGEIEGDVIFLGHFLRDETWDGQLLLNAMVITVFTSLLLAVGLGLLKYVAYLHMYV